MITEKAKKFEALKKHIENITGALDDCGCMVCASCSSQTVQMVADLLKEYGIDPKAVETEMRTLNPAFAFTSGWKSEPQSGCHVYISMFAMACYKFFMP